VYERWQQAGREESIRSYAVSAGASAGQARRPEIQILGSGSDYTVFFNHLGVPSLDMIFDGPYGVYHSLYDNFYWMSRFGDPTFDYHATMSRLWGVMALRLANSDLLPFDLSAYAEDLAAYAGSLKEHASKEFAARHLDAIAMEAGKLRQAAAAAEKRVQNILARERAGKASANQEARLQGIREEMRRLEQDLLHAEGIPGRPWFKHLIYAPLPSYEAETLPGIREAILQKDEQQAAAQAEILRRAIRKMTARLGALGR
jgi:N-acetylated-alpha-linked acidic dipeptidase